MLRIFRKQNEQLKQKITILDEKIITLFNNLREYMKILLKIELIFEQKQCDLNEDTKLIQSAIMNVFLIEDKVDFFSTSPDAFELNIPNLCLRLELKNSENTRW